MKRTLLIVLLCMIAHTSVIAQPIGLTSDGTAFYIGFIPSSIRCPSVQPFIHVYALISSYYDNSVRLDYFDNNGAELQGRSYQVPGKHSIVVDLDQVSMRPSSGGEIAEYKACHIVAVRPISVQYYSTGPASGTMYSVFPTPALGEHYVIASYPANQGQGAGGSRFHCDGTYLDSASSCFMIVAAHDSTHVTIIPNATTYRLRKTGVTEGTGSDGSVHPFQVTLNHGEIYWVKSEVYGAFDMSGSRVDADKPIAIVAGNEAAAVDTLSGSGGGANPPSRNLMLQQMIPSEYLSARNHISMPFVDFVNGVGPLSGEFFRIFTSDTNGATATVSVDQQGTTQYPLQKFGLGPTIDTVQYGINVSSSAGSPILVEQYDYRQPGTGAPTMMNVLARAQWKRTYAFNVPDDAGQVHRRHFINVIAQPAQFSKIKFSKDGSAPTAIGVLAEFGNRAKIPETDSFGLSGRRFEVSNGSYMLQSDSNFVVYQYGFLGIDPDNDLGDFDDDDYYFEYASPAGEQFFAQSPGSLRATVTSDGCSGWVVSVTESDSANMGLASMEVLNDPGGVYTMSGKQSFNVYGASADISGTLQADLHISILNPLRDAYAAVRIVSRTGKDTIIELRQNAFHFTLQSDSFKFVQAVGHDTCATIVLKNMSDSLARVFTFTNVAFTSRDSTLRILSTSPTLPTSFRPGDSLRVNFCYSPIDTLLRIDSIRLISDCSNIDLSIYSLGVSPIIKATDITYGTIPKGDSSCNAVTITNIGSSPLVISGGQIVGSSEFSFGAIQAFPKSLVPGESVNVPVCFHPTVDGVYTAKILWSTNLAGSFEHQIKDFSMLYARTLVRSVQKVNASESFSIHPNPVRGTMLIVEGDGVENGVFEIYDLLGGRIRTVLPSNALKRQSIEIGDLAAGAYYLRLSGGGQVETRKFVVER